jgi:proteic killer suppression protein
MAIQSFRDPETRRFFETGKTGKGAKWSSLKRLVARKLDMLDYASTLQDLQSPPGNRLEALSGDLLGCHSIRINDQWRIIFRWTERGPESVAVTDYH